MCAIQNTWNKTPYKLNAAVMKFNKDKKKDKKKRVKILREADVPQPLPHPSQRVQKCADNETSSSYRFRLKYVKKVYVCEKQ